MGMDEADGPATVLGGLNEVCDLLPYEIRLLVVIDKHVPLCKRYLVK